MKKRLDAANRIRSVWRFNLKFHSAARLVHRVAKNGLTASAVTSIAFKDLVTLLRRHEVIQSMKHLMMRLQRFCQRRHGAEPCSSDLKSVNVRVLLASFMIVYHPLDVFEERFSTLVKDLESASKAFMTQLEAILQAVLSGGVRFLSDLPHSLTAEFERTMLHYLTVFKAWKVPDEQKLCRRIEHALAALFDARMHLPPVSSESDRQLAATFAEQIDRLRGKLRMIGGPDRLAALDARMAIRQVDVVAGADNGVEASDFLAEGNEHLVHELLLDPLYQLSRKHGASLDGSMERREVRGILVSERHDTVVFELGESPPCYTKVFGLLGTYKTLLLRLLPSDARSELEELVDVDAMRVQYVAGAFGWSEFVGMIRGMFQFLVTYGGPTLTTATREGSESVLAGLEETAASERPVMASKCLRFLEDRIDAWSIAAANARLRLIAPIIGEHGIVYEQENFSDKLANGSITLARTRSWLASAVASAVTDGLVTHEQLLSGNAGAYTVVLRRGYLSIVSGTEAFPIEACPETLVLDHMRISKMRRGLVGYARVIVAALVSHQVVSSGASGADAWRLMEVSLSNCRGFTVAGVVEAFNKGLLSSSLDTRVKDELRTKVASMCEDGTPVMKIV